MLCFSHLLLVLGCGLVSWTIFNKVPSLATSVASFLSLLSSLISEDAIFNLDGHTLDIELADQLLHSLYKLDYFLEEED